MNNPEPEKNPPAGPEKRIPWLLLTNAGLLPVLYLVAAAHSNSGSHVTELRYFFLLVPLLLLNSIVAILAALTSNWRAALEFLLSILLILLVGLGACSSSW